LLINKNQNAPNNKEEEKNKILNIFIRSTNFSNNKIESKLIKLKELKNSMQLE